MTPMLVTTAWLAAHLGDQQVRPIDLRWYLTEPGRGRTEYLAAHIPGAAYLDVDDDLAAPPTEGPGRHPLPTPEAFAAAVGRTGIDSATHVVAYDASGGAYAARLWWLLRHFGHTQVSLLDGGWTEWLAHSYPTESGAATLVPTLFEPHISANQVRDAAAIEGLRTDPQVLLLDARAAERYEGRVEPIDRRAGHIPGAVSAPFTANLRADATFKSADALRAHYAALGATEAARIVCYCGSGVTATHNIFALTLAGFREPELYEGSWSDWSSDQERPIATGP